MVDAGWNPDDLVLDLEAGQIVARQSGGDRVCYSHFQADALIKPLFTRYRDMLPAQHRVHRLPLESVGALATLHLDALAGHSQEGPAEFIAISIGFLRLNLWCAVVASARGIPAFEPLSPADALPESEWWQSAMMPVALDLMGFPLAALHPAIGWTLSHEATESQRVLAELLRAFVVFHEIGHLEYGHGRVLHSYGNPNAVPPDVHHSLEYDADRFALARLQDMTADSDVCARALTVLFALFALTPEAVEGYPECLAAPTHPHPLVRFSALLRTLFPGDSGRQLTYLKFTVGLVGDAFAGAGIPEFKELEPVLWHSAHTQPVP